MADPYCWEYCAFEAAACCQGFEEVHCSAFSQEWISLRRDLEIEFL